MPMSTKIIIISLWFNKYLHDITGHMWKEKKINLNQNYEPHKKVNCPVSTELLGF
jgi:hypothetical protein